MSAKNEPKKGDLQITLVRGLVGVSDKQRKVATTLRLRKTNQVVYHPDTPLVRGNINKIQHLIKVEVL